MITSIFTLNFFRGIPRLREIVQTASRNITTPLTRIGVLADENGSTGLEDRMYFAQRVALRYGRTYLHELVTESRVTETGRQIGGQFLRTYVIELDFVDMEQIYKKFPHLDSLDKVSTLMGDGGNGFMAKFKYELQRYVRASARSRNRTNAIAKQADRAKADLGAAKTGGENSDDEGSGGKKQKDEGGDAGAVDTAGDAAKDSGAAAKKKGGRGAGGKKKANNAAGDSEDEDDAENSDEDESSDSDSDEEEAMIGKPGDEEDDLLGDDSTPKKSQKKSSGSKSTNDGEDSDSSSSSSDSDEDETDKQQRRAKKLAKSAKQTSNEDAEKLKQKQAAKLEEKCHEKKKKLQKQKKLLKKEDGPVEHFLYDQEQDNICLENPNDPTCKSPEWFVGGGEKKEREAGEEVKKMIWACRVDVPATCCPTKLLLSEIIQKLLHELFSQDPDAKVKEVKKYHARSAQMLFAPAMCL